MSTDRAHLAQTIERTYKHPDVSAWHVRESLRLLHAAVTQLQDAQTHTAPPTTPYDAGGLSPGEAGVIRAPAPHGKTVIGPRGRRKRTDTQEPETEADHAFITIDRDPHASPLNEGMLSTIAITIHGIDTHGKAQEPVTAGITRTQALQLISKLSDWVSGPACL